MTDGDKLQAIQKHTGMTWKDLAATIGIASPQTFVDIRSGRHGISTKLANKIITAFPNIRKEWIMFESGPMTVQEAQGMVAMFETTDDLGTGNRKDIINVGSCFPKADAAIRNTSEDMIEYPVGSVLVLRRVVDSNLLMPGRNYFIETEEFSTVKRIQKGKDDAHIALYSSNTSTYPDGKQIYEPFEIPVDSIRRIFSILGYIYTQATDINKV